MNEADENFEFSADNVDRWPFTPPVEVVRDLLEKDPNLLWRMDEGDLVNTLEEAIERLAAVENILLQALGRPIGTFVDHALRTVRHG